MHVTWKGTTWMDGEKKNAIRNVSGMFGSGFLSFVFFPGANAGCKGINFTAGFSLNGTI